MSDDNKHFNTSHVSINRFSRSRQIWHCPDFNTSHVSINRRRRKYPLAHQWISIHLMFLLISIFRSVRSRSPYFNTSHVSINPKFWMDNRYELRNFNTSHVSINPTLLSAFPFLLYLKFLENTSFFKFFPSVSQT